MLINILFIRRVLNICITCINVDSLYLHDLKQYLNEVKSLQTSNIKVNAVFWSLRCGLLIYFNQSIGNKNKLRSVVEKFLIAIFESFILKKIIEKWDYL